MFKRRKAKPQRKYVHDKKSKEKTALAAKKQRDGISGISPKRFSGRFRVRPRFARTVFLPFACACLAELAGVHAKARAERVALWGKSCATCHRQAHALVPNLFYLTILVLITSFN